MEGPLVVKRRTPGTAEITTRCVRRGRLGGLARSTHSHIQVPLHYVSCVFLQFISINVLRQLQISMIFKLPCTN